MTARHFCLKWVKFQTSILSAFQSLQTTEDLADVTLTCDGITIKAHKFILSVCSPYFRRIFKENPCSHPIVILKDVCSSDLMAIVNFMYHGEVTVTEDQLCSFLQTAKILQVSGLINDAEIIPKKPANVPQKKSKPAEESHDPCPSKKVKVAPKPKKPENRNKNETKQPSPDQLELVEADKIKTEDGENEQLFPDQFEMVEMDKIKTEDEIDVGINSDVAVSENVEVIDDRMGQSSVAEAASEARDTTIKRSLTSHSDRPPITHHVADKFALLPDPRKSTFVPLKPPEEVCSRPQKRGSFNSPSPSNSNSPPGESPQDHSETLEIMSPKMLNFQMRNVVLQPSRGAVPHCGKN